MGCNQRKVLTMKLFIALIALVSTPCWTAERIQRDDEVADQCSIVFNDKPGKVVKADKQFLMWEYIRHRIWLAEKLAGAPHGVVKSVELWHSTDAMHKAYKNKLPVGVALLYTPLGIPYEIEAPCEAATNRERGTILLSLETDDWKFVLDHELGHCCLYYGTNTTLEGKTPQQASASELGADHFAHEMKRLFGRKL